MRIIFCRRRLRCQCAVNTVHDCCVVLCCVMLFAAVAAVAADADDDADDADNADDADDADAADDADDVDALTH
jgi:hypothetical protein